MIPTDYANFLIASTQASAALIGLLFVSVSVAPQRVFGRGAEVERQTQALSAFTALVNAFFISFAGLIPRSQIGLVAVALGFVALSQTLALLLLLPRWRAEGRSMRGLTMFLLSAAVYGYEIFTGLRLWRSPADLGALTTLLDLLLVTYGVGLFRAWQLLGAPARSGLVAQLFGQLRRRSEPPGGAEHKPARHADVGGRADENERPQSAVDTEEERH